MFAAAIKNNSAIQTITAILPGIAGPPSTAGSVSVAAFAAAPTRPFASDELVVAAPVTPHYQAFQSMPSPLDALLNEPFLLREDNSGTKQETLYFLRNKGLSLDNLNVIAVMDDADSLKQCIILGMGISILSRATVQSDARQGKLLLFPLGESAFLRKLYIVYSPLRHTSGESQLFLPFAKEFYGVV